MREGEAEVSTSDLYKRRGQGIEIGYSQSIPLPIEATDALPGTEEKILVFIERASQGFQLFHPDDEIKLERYLR